MFNVKKALAGVLAGVTLISVAACGNGPDPAAGGSSSQQGQTVEQIKKTGKIRIATFGDLMRVPGPDGRSLPTAM